MERPRIASGRQVDGIAATRTQNKNREEWRSSEDVWGWCADGLIVVIIVMVYTRVQSRLHGHSDGMCRVQRILGACAQMPTSSPFNLRSNDSGGRVSAPTGDRRSRAGPGLWRGRSAVVGHRWAGGPDFWGTGNAATKRCWATRRSRVAAGKGVARRTWVGGDGGGWASDGGA